MNSNPSSSQTYKQTTSFEGSPNTDNSPNAENDNLITIGQQRVSASAVTTKIYDDIAFLEDRIRRMEKMKSPAETVLNTYRAMLESRQSILKSLGNKVTAQENGNAQTGT